MDGKTSYFKVSQTEFAKQGSVWLLQAMFSVRVERDCALEANMQTAQLFVQVAPGLAELHLSSPDVSVRCAK